MKINVELLKRIAQGIVENPTKFQMESFTRFDRYGCNGGCIAGWAVLLGKGNDQTTFENLHKTVKFDRGISETATKLLFQDDLFPRHLSGLPGLFFVCEWPAKFRDAYNQASTTGIKAKVAAEYIHHLIKESQNER